MSRKSFLDMTRWGQMKHIRKCMKTNEESTAVNDKENSCSSEILNDGGFVAGKSNTEIGETRNVATVESCTSVSTFQKSIPDEEIAWDNLFEEPLLSDESEDENSLPTQTENEKLQYDLKNWAVRFHISHVAISALLCILRMHKCFNLPCDSRTLLQTPLTVSVESVSPGLYSHIGLEYNLIKLWSKVTEVVHSIHLMIGIDGLPLFTSSSQSFWPIMGFVNNVKQIKSIVFPIGIFFGKKKPTNCSDFLKAFVTEAVNLIDSGIVLNGKVVKVVIQGFVCDAPAKSYILGIKSHTGYSSCTKCTQTGMWYHNQFNMFAIVKFLDENDAPGIVCTHWINEELNMCLYPNVKTNEARDKLLRRLADPEHDWSYCRIKILHNYSSFNAANQHLLQAEETSNLDSEDETLNRPRKRTKTCLLYPGEESDDSTSLLSKTRTTSASIPYPVPPEDTMSRSFYSPPSPKSPCFSQREKHAASRLEKPSTYSSSQTIMNGKMVAWMADISLRFKQLESKVEGILENQKKTAATASPSVRG